MKVLIVVITAQDHAIGQYLIDAEKLWFRAFLVCDSAHSIIFIYYHKHTQILDNCITEDG